jgi:hypothetical protein
MAWCSECKKEFDGEVCPVCGELLEPTCEKCGGEHPEGCSGDCSACTSECDDCSDDIWPVGDDGQPVPPALLTTVTGSRLDYEMTLSLLHSFGVPTIESFTSGGSLAKEILGFAGTGMDVLVPETMLELARELLKPVDEGPTDGEEDGLQTGI